MSSHTTISPGEAADRLAVRELVEAYAHYAAPISLVGTVFRHGGCSPFHRRSCRCPGRCNDL